MIGFFRRIRKTLADDNQFLKYSRYAVGEILLVVIGILIALQVNTWNENQKNRKEEFKYLNGIISDLTVDSLNYDSMSRYMSRVVEVNNSILRKFSENEEIDEQDYKNAFKTFTIPPVRGQNSTFDEMQSSGKLNLIKDDSLRNKILHYYSERDFIRKVEALNNQLITQLPISNKIDLNSFLHLNINLIEEVDEISFDFFNNDRESQDVKEYINTISIRSLMSLGNKSVYENGLKQSTELKNEILAVLKTF